MTACETVLTRRRWRTGGAVAIAMTAALSLGACAAGQHAQTVEQYSVVDGAMGNVGSIGVRDAGIAAPKDVAGYAAGDSAQLVLALVNNGTSADQLVSVTSSAAASVVLATSGSSTPAPGSAASSDSASAPPSTASPSRSATGSGPISIPPNTLVRVGAGQPAGGVITMTGLKQPLTPGVTVPVTFAFASAGRITIQLPVKLIADGTGGETVSIPPASE